MNEDLGSAVVFVLGATAAVLALICFLREEPSNRAKENR